MTSGELCRTNGWVPGDRLVGDEGYGPTVIELVAIGERLVLAKPISHNGVARGGFESAWTLDHRDWRKTD